MLLRCPQCRQITSDRARTFPRCIHCGYQLAQCRYCRHFDAQTRFCRSPHRDRPTPVSPDDLPTCGHYLSRLDLANAPLRRLARGAVPWAAAMLVVAALITAGLYLRPGLQERRHAGQAATLELSGNREMASEVPAMFYLRVCNTGPKAIRDLQLHVGGQLFNACEVSLVPAFHSHEFNKEERMHCYHFGTLKPGATLQVELTVQPRLEARYSRVAWETKACGDEGVVLARTSSVVHIMP